MRIQHNIPALNAYRSYTQNVAAMKKNLEKLSSGYRINRAGDDAAGLAISEKMRAQITGLEVAQKNAKDGISLVQTAEGAMTEVHDMLNRMYELAEQSANGTYDNETDRAQMQKEIQSLSDEINRIADSSNFNGIKLVDGSLSKAGVAATTKMFGDLPGVGQTLGVDTVLHQGATSGSPETTFSLDFHNQEIKGGAGQTFELKIGNQTLTGTLKRDCTTTALSAEEIAEALADSTNTTNVEFEVNGAAYDSNAFTIDGAEFKASAPGKTDRVTFTQTNPDDVQFTPDLKVEFVKPASVTAPIAKITATDGAAAGAAAPNAVGTAPTITKTPGDGAGTAGTISIDVAGISLDGAGRLTLDIDGGTTVVQSDNIADADKADAQKIAEAFIGKTFTLAGKTFTGSANGTVITFTQSDDVNVGANAAWTGITGSATLGAAASAATTAKVEVDFDGKTGADVLNQTLEIDGKTYEFVQTGSSATGTNIAVEVNSTDDGEAIATALNAAVTGANSGNAPANLSSVTYAGTGSVITFEAAAAGAQTADAKLAGSAEISGDYNVSTTVVARKAEAAGDRLASTHFEVTSDMVDQGNTIKIGKTNYVFQTEKGNAPTAGANEKVVDVSDLDTEAADYITKVVERLTEAAADNAVYSVGIGGNGNRVTVTENVSHATDLTNSGTYPPDEYDLTTFEGIQKSLGYGTAAKAGTGGLTLQIGDTADSYNKLTVSINDCHTAAMGLGDIDISTQDGASAAMKKIKSAINYVSDVRGDLGALQNRLDHTINNLSVMHENIQDAESTIRDVDIAEEMMAYTKNNILVQSSQAMLAQANQLPQGVLQLLQ